MILKLHDVKPHPLAIPKKWSNSERKHIDYEEFIYDIKKLNHKRDSAGYKT